ncbi:NAD(P)H-dependent oxidoreductase [bacterium SCSIO 12741]|nr:NAD(P)H-dependent oxidoreductase [bacterium SCSIO 12741]
MDSLKWRAAVRKYDTSKKVSAEDLELLLEAGNLTATSMGLQPFKIVVVSDPELQRNLVPESYNQQHVADASHILVFAVETDLGQKDVDAYIKRAMELRNLPASALEGYKNSISHYLGSMSEEVKLSWATKQAYIALGTVMTVAAELKIDSCAMEGFNPESYQKMLGLDSKNLLPVVILPIGYRSEEEMMASLPKVRKHRDDFVLEISNS